MTEFQHNIDLPPSSKLAEEIIYLGMMQGRDVVISDTDGLQVSDDLTDFAEKVGYGISCSDGNIEVTSAGDRESESKIVEVTGKRDFFRKLLVLARNRAVTPLAIPEDTDGDFESELILYRRMGFDYDLIEDDGRKVCLPTQTEAPGIKYRLPAKSYHLLDSIVCGAIASGCSVDLVSPVEVHPTEIMAIPDIGVELQLQKDGEEQDELARRLKRLIPSGKKKYRYTVQRQDSSSALRAALPRDFLPGLFFLGAGCIRSISGFRVSGFTRSEAISAFCRMLTRMGIDAALRNSTNDTAGGQCEVTLSPGELAGKRFGGSDIRSCPESFAVLASLGMFAEGKTVIRDLPFGSILWRRRVGFVRDVLEECGARVGEVEDGLVVEKGADSMMTSWVETTDPYCDMFQQMLSIALPHHSSYVEPAHFQNSQLIRLYNVQLAETVR